MTHYLVIGGTGMLQAAVLNWIEEGHEVTVVARTKESLLRLSKRAEQPDRLHTIQADYLQLPSFQNQLKHLSAPDIIISWIHSSGNDAVQAMCDLYGTLQKPISFFHIKGSSAQDPRHNYIPKFAENIDYHEVILGFRITEGFSRWLTNQEIADGISQAVKHPQPRCIVGTVWPWSARP
ncbi:hypothetical protein SAMN05421663_10995 [Terribacillus halophilus]|uniref:Short chain dehydrogenase n=1 Tax=Terribacillus halophilus TaxID=361279 RepID=A0A1G6TXD3_9BACI|nr:hypothetical protein [Terribacillus halophilus]SDD33832.1 hypothetical protein SAMN05421663_10995 [Terribacillus halophilus]